jgi:enoyl-CoA hydratase
MKTLIEVTEDGAVATIALARPEKRNALSMELIAALATAIDDLAASPATSVIVLRAEGPAFCAGYDLGGRYGEKRAVPDPWQDRMILRRMNAANEAIWNCPIPIVAAVHGACLAGGADLALHCDFLLVADDVRIGYPPVRNLGTPPHNIWLYRLGVQRAKLMLLTGDSLDAATAVDWGLALSTHAPADLAQTAHAFATRLSMTGKELLIANKWVLNRGVDLMGRQLLNQFALTEDALAHTSPAAMEFKARVAEEGLVSAFRERDARDAQL